MCIASVNLWKVSKMRKLEDSRSKSNKLSSGFTLVEVTIVIAVISLMFGAVMVGYNIVTAASVNSFIRDVEGTNSSLMRFQENYMLEAGDFNEATSIWSDVAGVADGNADGQVAGAEINQVWLHLSASEIIKISYTTSLAETKLNGGKLMYMYLTNVPSGALPKTTNHLLYVGDGSTAALFNPTVSAVEASEIDIKMDDGVPLTGNVIGSDSTSVAGCVNAGAYNVSNDARSCIMVFSR